MTTQLFSLRTPAVVTACLGECEKQEEDALYWGINNGTSNFMDEFRTISRLYTLRSQMENHFCRFWDGRLEDLDKERLVQLSEMVHTKASKILEALRLWSALPSSTRNYASFLTENLEYRRCYWGAQDLLLGPRDSLGRELLRSGAFPWPKTVTGNLPLHYAAAKGSAEICSTLLRAPNVTVNLGDTSERSPLHSAMNNDHVDTAICLVKSGKFDINPTDQWDDSFLIHAVLIDSEGLVKCLMDFGEIPLSLKMSALW
ncbi:ankyrin [Lentithecium fluviatile CBS 122367]|uniref:Ankyrin n=1 Tax=Lentithecium fluviatile CBS 122367 TaxID=1168545 RepID=A0A6G1IQD3_9PLEO|nr:ankyrin [Lentithecium fluviatile CBS 122367]